MKSIIKKDMVITKIIELYTAYFISMHVLLNDNLRTSLRLFERKLTFSHEKGIMNRSNEVCGSA